MTNCPTNHEALQASEEAFETLEHLNIWPDAGIEAGKELVIGNCVCRSTLAIECAANSPLVALANQQIEQRANRRLRTTLGVSIMRVA